MELQIVDSNKVTSIFGYWPKFCDAKCNGFSLGRSSNGNRFIKICFLYLDSDQSLGAKIDILFGDVSKVNLTNFFDENVLDELVIGKNNDDSDSHYDICLKACYGLEGTFKCNNVSVENALVIGSE